MANQGRSRIDHKNVSPYGKKVPSIDFDIAAQVCVCEWGPMGVATKVTSWDDYVSKFGKFLASYHGAVHAQQFLDSGNAMMISRTCHWSGATPATAAKSTSTCQTGATSPTYGTVTGTVAAPFALADGDTIQLTVDSVLSALCTFNAGAATIDSGEAETFNLVSGSTLTFSINGGADQVVTFVDTEYTAGAATAEQVAAILNAQLIGVNATATSGGTRVTLTTDKKGTEASINLVESGGGTYGTDANAILHFPVATQTGTGDCADADSVTLAELKTLIEGDISGVTASSSGSYLTIRTNTAGTGGNIQVVAASTLDSKLGLDNATHTGISGAATDTLRFDGLYYGTLGNRLTRRILTASNGDAEYFNVEVRLDGDLVDSWPNLTMDSTNTAQYAVNVINTLESRSNYVRVTDMAAPGTATQRRPVNGSAAYLTGGDDGLTGLATADYTGSSTYKTGLYAFDLVRDGDILICPEDTSTTFQNAATAYCDTTKQGKMFFLPDAPLASDADAAVLHASGLNASEARSKLLWPWRKITNPDKTIFGQTDTILIAPSSRVAYRMAMNSKEQEKAMWTQPGNETYGYLDGSVGIETDTANDSTVQDKVTDGGINPVVAGIRYTDNLYGVWLNDVQAGKDSGNFKSIGENRGVTYLRKQIEAYLDANYRTQGLSEDDRQDIQAGIEGILGYWCKRNCFATKDIAEAFYVNADAAGNNLNNALVRAQQKFYVLVAIATQEPARFMTIMFTKDQRAVNSYIQQQMSTNSNTLS